MDAITFTAEVRENTFDEPGDGGRVVVHCNDAEVRKAGWLQMQLIGNAAEDHALEPFPRTRTDKAARKFRITVEEITE